MRVQVDPADPRTVPRGIDLHIVDDDDDNPPVAIFGAAVQSQHMKPGGEMTVTLIVPFDQVPNVMPVMQYIGGVQFEITVRRVSLDKLPEPGW